MEEAATTLLTNMARRNTFKIFKTGLTASREFN
jgi:hypothetical protein